MFSATEVGTRDDHCSLRATAAASHPPALHRPAIAAHIQSRNTPPPGHGEPTCRAPSLATLTFTAGTALKS
ncbi:unnamed protein product [Pieris macdunnoughi]|uniref:Uncharacterized protein n=1 Tax=Pieris macdunnoughi TaxID=345717 RepID=A0A821Q7D7_9NEOP|nr:unnamed protein product [Pieris macdunnoughi]